MKWEKKGLIYSPESTYEWRQSHAQCPVVDLYPNKWRIYFATRNTSGQSRISFLDVQAGHPEHIDYISDYYLVDLGKPGAFDDSGLMPTCIVNYNNFKYLYYIGWTTRKTVPYHNSIGLLISPDNGQSFTRVFDGPILSPIHTEPYFTGTAYVLIENGIWRMWYLSCTEWISINNYMEPRYHIKYAESKDGIIWKRDGIIAIDYTDETEGGIVSASVIKEKTHYKMWYAYRKKADYRFNKNNSYRIGYAESQDGTAWQRMDGDVGISLSEHGWDSVMMCYPYVIKHNYKYFMFYNGNGFGKTGIGYAIAQ